VPKDSLRSFGREEREHTNWWGAGRFLINVNEERTRPAIQLGIGGTNTLMVLVSIVVRKSENDALRMVLALAGLELHQVMVILEVLLAVNIPENLPIASPASISDYLSPDLVQ
jgi:hypothetical protein